LPIDGQALIDHPSVVSSRLRGFAILVAALSIGLSSGVSAQDAQRRVSERLRALQAEAEQLLAAEKTLLVELRQLEVERDIRLEERRDAVAALAAATAELTTTSTHLEALDRAQSAQVPGLASRLAEVYKLGSGGYLRLLLSVDDMREMGRAYRTVSALAAFDRERVRAHQTTLDSLREARKELEARRATAASLEAQARGAALAAERAVAARTALIGRIDAQRDLNAQLAGELDGARAKLAAAVSSLAPGAAPALPFRPFRGGLDWPVSGIVASRFGAGRPASYGTAGASNGIEIATTTGTTVVAVHEGTVAYAAPFTGFGPLVILDHGDRAYTLYGYLATLGVTKGTRVEKGSKLGTVGSTPATGRPSLYFEVRVDGKATDPLQWLKPRTQRLP
jgi:septal ring factor EnvC (AmiA/AmiB activator)